MGDLALSFILKLLILITLVFIGLVASQNTNEPPFTDQSDLVKSLPGYTGNYSKHGHYSGYLKADDRTFLHYWFFKSRTGNWRNDPVLVWINGGPGASSVGKGVSWFGAFLLHEGSLKHDHKYSDYAWVGRANVLYFDTPPGVGFSYQLDPKDKDIKDTRTTDYNHAAIKNFFDKFPHFQNNTFYLTGESYASIYISLLGARLVQEKFPPNFKGILYTSAFFSGTTINAATAEHGYQLGLFDQTHWIRFVESCCPATFCSVRECFFKKINQGNCYFQDRSPCCDAFRILENLSVHNKKKFDQTPKKRIPDGVPIYPQDWLRQESVMKALNINRNFSTPEWTPFNVTVLDNNCRAHSVLEQVRTLLENGIRMVLCYGDSDLNTSYLNGLWLLDYLADQLTTVQPHTPWFVEGQLAGYQRQLVYTNRDNTTKTSVTLVVVRHAGHDVKVDQTKRYFKIVDDFFAGV